MTKTYLPDSAFHGAPQLSTDRPPTRREVWDHYSYVYGETWTHEKIVDWCRTNWIAHYVYWYNVRGWRKQPDWKESDPVIPEAVPTTLFFPDQQNSWRKRVYDCLERSKN